MLAKKTTRSGKYETCLCFLGQNAVGFCVHLVVEEYGFAV